MALHAVTRCRLARVNESREHLRGEVRPARERKAKLQRGDTAERAGAGGAGGGAGGGANDDDSEEEGPSWVALGGVSVERHRQSRSWKLLGINRRAGGLQPDLV